MARARAGAGRRRSHGRRAALSALSTLVVTAALLVAAPSPADAFGSSAPPPIPSVSAGGYVTCGVHADGRVACWGENGMPSNDVPNTSPGGAATPPAGAFLEVNAGYATVCGVRVDQTLACWGSDRFGKHLVPAGTFTHVAPGLNYVCALRTEGTLACWGGEVPTLDPDQLVLSTMPSGAFTQVSMGNRHACALRADGSIACWGINADGQTNVPPGTYQAVNVSNFTSCALRTDGTPVCWGRNQGGQQAYPPGATFTQLSTGFAHVCGLRPDRTVTCWGRSSEGQTVVPPGTYTQVSAGTFHTCAVPVSGPPVRCWGNNMSGRVQPNLSAVPPAPAYVGSPYGFQFTMNPSTHSTLGGEAKLSAPTYSVTAGALPPGLSLSPAGALSGTPTAAGDHTFTVAAGNGLSPLDCANPSVGSQSMPCTPGDPASVATATRVFTVSVSPDAPVPGAIGGVVTALAGGAPVAGAVVAVTHAGGAPAGEAVTGADGGYLLGDLPPGSYDVRASGPELQPQTKPAAVSEGQTTTVDFALGPLVRPTVVGVSNNHYQTVTDGVFVHWSEAIQPFGLTAANYTVHARPDCADPAVATASEGFWQPSSPALRDLAMDGWEAVVPGGTYHLRVAAGTELGTDTQQRNAAACV
ncbi:MAG: carboxypeptidase regulatory-like domain-containing protein, partial [Acidimicrobiales bacterium]